MIAEQRESGVPYLERTLLPAQPEEVLELDEMWSYVGKKKNRVWIWIALCRRTRQVVAWWGGPRDRVSCQTLWDRIPAAYKRGLCYTDFYATYKSVVPPDQHCPGPKRDGQTNHRPKGTRRFNLTLRQSLSRFVRKTLSFSKKLLPHIQALRLFFVAYNQRTAIRYQKQNLASD